MQFGFHWDMHEKLSYHYTHGKLRSMIDDSLRFAFYTQVGSRPPDVDRYMVAHKLTFKPFKSLALTGGEAPTDNPTDPRHDVIPSEAEGSLSTFSSTSSFSIGFYYNISPFTHKIADY